MGLRKECAKKAEPFPGRGWSVWVGLALKASLTDCPALVCRPHSSRNCSVGTLLCAAQTDRIKPRRAPGTASSGSEDV